MITTRAQKEQTLKNEISRSLLIQQNEKDFWLKKITILPEINLDRLLAQFQNKNKIVDGFLASALEKDPDHQYLSKLKNLLNQLGLVWGVDVFFYNKFVSTDESIDDIIGILKKEEVVSSGDIIVSTASMPITGRGRTNMVKISKIK